MDWSRRRCILLEGIIKNNINSTVESVYSKVGYNQIPVIVTLLLTAYLVSCWICHYSCQNHQSFCSHVFITISTQLQKEVSYTGPLVIMALKWCKAEWNRASNFSLLFVPEEFVAVFRPQQNLNVHPLRNGVYDYQMFNIIYTR